MKMIIMMHNPFANLTYIVVMKSGNCYSLFCYLLQAFLSALLQCLNTKLIPHAF